MSSTTEGMSLRHERIMASAGSGKTFQLTNRYLRLILEGEQPPSILASTFTRLAAGEIRDRILERLAEAATHEAKRSELATHAGISGLTGPVALERLVDLTRHMHRMQVRTIDSFFSGIVRCFALELGLDPAATIIDEETERQFRREAIMQLLDERDPQPIIDLLRILTEGSTDRTVTESIDSLVKGLYDLYRDAPPEAWESIKPAPMLSRNELADAIAALEQYDVSGEVKRVMKAHVEDCARARSVAYDDYNGWIEFVSKGIAKALAAGKTSYYKELDPSLIAMYRPLLDHCSAVVRNSVINRTLAMRDLLDRFHVAFEQVKAANKALTFSDITWKMTEAERLGTLDEICFRLDATLRHVLLDEMQDTSIAQWRALMPMVNEIISHAPPQRTFFCVGDVKQSIYGWRKGCPEILETLCETLVGAEGQPVIAGDRQLVKSWRSSQIIMDVVNRVLDGVSDNEAVRDYPQAAAQWDEAFAPHETARNMPGYVELRTVRRASKDAGEKQGRARLEEAASLVRDLQAKCPEKSIGVLVRSNKVVNFLLYELGPARLNVPNVSGRGGGAITDSAAVNVVLDLLRLADHPEHTVAAFNVMHSPLGDVVGLRSMADCRNVSRRIRRRVLEGGYASAIHSWIGAIGECTDARQLRRLMQLQELAVEFDQRATLRCDDFLDMVQSRRVDDPVAASVQVMTVHQSKGLEFDIVVLPELDEPLTKSTFQILEQRDGAAGRVTALVRHINETVTSLVPEADAMRRAAVERQAREGLCLLYVAMTRARHALYMLINPLTEKQEEEQAKGKPPAVPKTYAGLLRSALVNGDILPSTVLDSRGDQQWFQRIAASTDQETESVATHDGQRTRVRLAPSPGDTVRGRASDAASSHASREALARQLSLPNTAARERGTLIHAMFEQITWLDELQPQRDQLLQLARRLAPRRDSQWHEEQVHAFEEMLRHPTIKAALSRGEAADDSLQLYREYPFARLVDGAVQRGFIDRLVVRAVDGSPVDATIIDFKTDVVEAAEVNEKSEAYRHQLETYREAAASALGLAKENVSMTLLFTEPGVVVEL